jgi:hypothetical protein
MTALKQLGSELREKGYTELVVEGLRYSGAKKGKMQAVVLDLTSLKK